MLGDARQDCSENSLLGFLLEVEIGVVLVSSSENSLLRFLLEVEIGVVLVSSSE